MIKITADDRPCTFELLLAMVVANGGVNRETPEPNHFWIPSRFESELDGMEARIEHLTNEEIDTFVDGEETEQLMIAGRSPELTRAHEMLVAVFEGEIDCPHWRCFHCDEVFYDRAAAAEHFGEGNYEGEMPLCIEAATSEMKALVLTNREMFERVQKAERETETAEFRLGNFEYVARKLTKKPAASTGDLEMAWDFMEGRVIAAEAAINAAPYWLAQWLRRRAERRAA